MDAVTHLRALARGARSEGDRRWLIGPEGALAAARELVAAGETAAVLGDLGSLSDWLDDASFASTRRPSDRLHALLALPELTGASTTTAIAPVLDRLVAGYGPDGRSGDSIEVVPTPEERPADAVIRVAGSAELHEVEQLTRLVHGRVVSGRRRAVTVTVPVSAHHAGELVTLHLVRVAGPPGIVVDRAAAPFLDRDAAFADALTRAHEALRCDFAVRWYAVHERSGRPVEWITGPSVALAAAAGIRALAGAGAVPSDLVVTGDVDAGGRVRSLVTAGRHDYDAKLDAAAGRRVVVPVVDASVVHESASRRTSGPIVLAVDDIAELDALLDPIDRLPSSTRLPRPGVDGERGLVGRGAELARLTALVTAPGATRVGFVTGRSGIGKTALVDRFAATQAHSERVDGGERSHDGRVAAFVDACLTDPRDRLLVVDDAHGVPDHELARLAELVLSGAGPRTTVVLATPEPHRQPALARLFAAAAAGHPDVVGFELAPLDDVAVEAIVVAELGPEIDSMDPTIAKRIVAIAQGDPLVATLLVDLTTRDPSAVLAGIGDRSSDLATQLVDDALRALPGTEVLEAAAIVGGDLEPATLQAVAKVDADRFWDLVAASLASGLLVERGRPARYRCAHRVVAEAVTGRLTATRANQLHRRAAAHLERRDDVPGRVRALAHHYGALVPAEVEPKALDFAVAAARDAEATRDFDDAHHWYGRAVALAGRVAELEVLVDAQIGLGRSGRRCGAAGAGTVLLSAAQRAAGLARPDLLVEAVLGAHRGFFSATGRVNEPWIALLERAVAGVTEPIARAELLAVLSAELTWEADATRRCALADEALDLALVAGSLPTIARVRYRRSLAIARADTVIERAENAVELAVVAARLGDDESRFAAAITRATVAAEIARMDEALVAVHDAEVLADGLRDHGPRFSARLARAGSLLTQGAIDAAARVSDDALVLGRAADAADAAMLHGEQSWEIARLRGDHDAYRAMALMIATLPDPSLSVLGARYAEAAGALGEARTAYERATEGGSLRIPNGLAETAIERDLAVLARRFGDAAVAQQLVERLRHRPDHFANTTIVRPAGRHALGLATATLGRLDESEHWFATAVDLHLAVRAPLLAVESLVEWAASIVDLGGDRARAVAMLDRASGLLDDHPASGLAALVGRERARAGG